MGEEEVRCAIIGYGPVFNWGWMHARWLSDQVDARDTTAIV